MVNLALKRHVSLEMHFQAHRELTHSVPRSSKRSGHVPVRRLGKAFGSPSFKAQKLPPSSGTSNLRRTAESRETVSETVSESLRGCSRFPSNILRPRHLCNASEAAGPFFPTRCGTVKCF